MTACYCVLVTCLGLTLLIVVRCLEVCSTSGDVCSYNDGGIVGLDGTPWKG